MAANVFEAHCSGCHGLPGSPRPSVAELAAAPPDLTRLHEKYGSPLPREQLAAFIDGRKQIDAHGSRDMPVWGQQLYAHLPDARGVEEMREGTIALLLDYLDAIQERREDR